MKERPWSPEAVAFLIVLHKTFYRSFRVQSGLSAHFRVVLLLHIRKMKWMLLRNLNEFFWLIIKSIFF